MDSPSWDDFDAACRTINRLETKVAALEQRIEVVVERLAAYQKPALTLVKNEEAETSRIA